jgi:hypothetical protein
MLIHERGQDVSGGAEETTTGLLRLRRLEAEGTLACPVVAVNESRTERTFNDRYGTGQSALDGSCAPPTCCSPAARWCCSATAPPARGSPSGRAAPAPP